MPPRMEPLPPFRLAPPSITAVITLSSSPVPDWVDAAPNLEVNTIAAIEVRIAIIT